MPGLLLPQDFALAFPSTWNASPCPTLWMDKLLWSFRTQFWDSRTFYILKFVFFTVWVSYLSKTYSRSSPHHPFNFFSDDDHNLIFMLICSLVYCLSLPQNRSRQMMAHRPNPATISFYKLSFVGTQPHLFIYHCPSLLFHYNNRADYLWQRLHGPICEPISCLVSPPKIFAICLFLKKVWQPLP